MNEWYECRFTLEYCIYTYCTWVWNTLWIWRSLCIWRFFDAPHTVYSKHYLTLFRRFSRKVRETLIGAFYGDWRAMLFFAEKIANCSIKTNFAQNTYTGSGLGFGNPSIKPGWYHIRRNRFRKIDSVVCQAFCLDEGKKGDKANQTIS